MAVDRPSFSPASRPLGLGDIWQARHRIHGRVWRTPLVYSQALSERTGCQVYLKMECWQVCGCFKVRGAVNMVTALTPQERERGLVAASSGNHGIALAYAASLFPGTRATVFLPEGADPAKVRKIRAFGAETRFHGKDYLAALAEAKRVQEAEGRVFVHSHAHPLIMAGQGTIGLEIMEDLPDADAILVPVGGGGLISGIALAAKSLSERVKVIAVEPSAAPGAYLSFQEGRPCEQIDLRPTLADGLSGGFAPLAWEVSRDLIHEAVLVEDEEIAHAMRVFQEAEQLMVEGAASVGLAALLYGKVNLRGEKVVLVLTSRNIDAARYNRVVAQKEVDA